MVDRNNLSNTFTFITGSLLPQGDLFPVFINTGLNNAKFTDVRVSYNDPTNVHPFSTVYRPPSGSYAGSDEWNNWYDGIYASASLMIVLSAFSGLREFGLSFSSVFDPDYKILPLQGKTI